MLRSRIASSANRSFRYLLTLRNQAPRRGLSEEPISAPPDDPAVPTGRPEEMKEKYEPDPLERPTDSENSEKYKPLKGTEPLKPSSPPHVPNPKLERVGVHNPAEPIVQRRREMSSQSSTEERSRAATPTEEDNVQYYKHHKPSPISEVEFADTRKPITRATDSAHIQGDVIGWRPEQLLSAEETMERARRIWLENAMRGDPNSPHGRVLRELRGEWF